MSNEIEKSQPREESLFESILALKSTMLAYIKVRLQLLGMESKSAVINLALVIFCAVFTAMLLLFVWPVAMVMLGFLIFEWGGGYWAAENQSALIWPVFLAILLVHIAIAALLIVLAKWRLKHVSLKQTLDEIKKDREWINSLKNKL
jgi:uncharacterized membrane protein YqjE